MSHPVARSPHRLVLLVASLACLASWSSRGVAAETAAEPAPKCRTQLREGDEFWQASTRHLGGCATAELAAQISVHQRLDADDCSTWVGRSVTELIQADPKRATIFYVHGNRVSPDEATTNGWRLYQKLIADDSPPVRLVVWSWPSDRVRGPLRDVRSKAARTEDEAFYFGWVLRRLATRQRVGLLGYSFGARVVTGGLHLAAGGELYGETLAPLDAQAVDATQAAGTTSDDRSPSDAAPSESTFSTRFSVLLAAAAEHHHWLTPGSLHGRALEPVDQLFNLYNSCDPVLARYRMIDRCERPTALGYAGLAPESLGEAAAKFEQRNAASTVGGTHEEAAYLGYGLSGEELRRYLLPEAKRGE